MITASDMAQTILHSRRLRKDRVAFGESLVPHLDEWQREALASDHQRLLFLCARQSGKSTISAIIALHQALFTPRSLVLCLAPALRQSQELFGKIATFYQATGRITPPFAERKLSLELRNGSRILCLPGTEKTVRGFSGVSLLLIDEAARADDNLYYSMRPMLAVSGGRLIMLSTPYGRRGAFYDAYMSDEDWDRYVVRAEDCPRIPKWFLKEERESLPQRVYEQEYECRFVETEEQVFSEAVIESITTDEFEPLDY